MHRFRILEAHKPRARSTMMIMARVIGMTVGLVVGLSGWLLQWESYFILALLTVIYLIIMGMTLARTEDFPTGLAGALVQIHAEWFFAGAWLMAIAMFPLQYI